MFEGLITRREGCGHNLIKKILTIVNLKGLEKLKFFFNSNFVKIADAKNVAIYITRKVFTASMNFLNKVTFCVIVLCILYVMRVIHF